MCYLAIIINAYLQLRSDFIMADMDNVIDNRNWKYFDNHYYSNSSLHPSTSQKTEVHFITMLLYIIQVEKKSCPKNPLSAFVFTQSLESFESPDSCSCIQDAVDGFTLTKTVFHRQTAEYSKTYLHRLQHLVKIRMEKLKRAAIENYLRNKYVEWVKRNN